MKIVNLTPHALRIRRVDGTDIVIEPSGIVPRLEVSRAECAPVICADGVEIAVSRATFGALTGMPESEIECRACGAVYPYRIAGEASRAHNKEFKHSGIPCRAIQAQTEFRKSGAINQHNGCEVEPCLVDPNDRTDEEDGSTVIKHIFVVSALCAQSPELAGRTDVYAPGEALRDSAGKIIGCVGLLLINPLAGTR